MKCFAIFGVFGLCAATLGQVTYSTVGAVYTEDFDSLPTSATFQNLDGTWVNGVTLPGWSRLLTSDGTPGVENRWRVDDGNAPGGSLYCYGAFGSTDRALGFVTSSNIPLGDIGVALRNDTGQVLTSVTVDYMGEQWRHGSADSHGFAFSYGLGNPDLTSGIFNAHSGLDFLAPQVLGPNVGINGNEAANRVAVGSTLWGLEWQPDQLLWLRWTGANAPASDHGLALDDLRVRAVPEPATLAVLTLGAILVRRRR